jgi:hypothetical protein
MKRRILRSVLLAIVLGVIVGLPVLAVPDLVTNFAARPTSTSVTLTWTKAPSSTITRVRFLTTGFPTDPTGVGDGSTSIYFSTLSSYEHTGLTSGTTYYYSAWGYDGAVYSSTPINVSMTTLAAASTGSTLSSPTMPLNTKPDSSGWWDRLQPFTGIVDWFASDWGMPRDNMNYTFATFILLLVGIGLYLKLKSPLIAMGADLIVDFGFIGMGLMSPFSIGYILAIGLGVWALETYTI